MEETKVFESPAEVQDLLDIAGLGFIKVRIRGTKVGMFYLECVTLWVGPCGEYVVKGVIDELDYVDIRPRNVFGGPVFIETPSISLKGVTPQMVLIRARQMSAVNQAVNIPARQRMEDDLAVASTHARSLQLSLA